MPQTSPSDVLQDQDFRRLSRDDQRTFLSSYDPDFKKLTYEDQSAFLDHALGPEQGSSVRPFTLPEMPGGMEGFKQGAVGAGRAAYDDLRGIGAGIRDWWKQPLLPQMASAITFPGKVASGIKQGAQEVNQTFEDYAQRPRTLPNALALGRDLGDIALGTDPRAAEYSATHGDPGGAAYQRYVRPAAIAGASEVGGRAVGLLTDPLFAKLPLTSRELPEWEISREARSELERFLGRDLPKEEGERLNAKGGILDRMTPYLRIAAKQIGLDDKTAQEVLAGREYEISHPGATLKGMKDRSEYRVSKGVDARRAIFERAEEIFGDKFDALIQNYGHETLNPQRMGTAIRTNIDEYKRLAAPNMANRLGDIAQRAENSQFTTLAEWDQMRKEYNALADDAFKARQAGATGADAETEDAYRRTADAIREAEYGQLSVLSGLPSDQIQNLQRMHRDAVQMLRANEAATQRAGPAQAEHQVSLIKRAFAGSHGERTPSTKRGIVSIMMPGPQGEQNIALRRALRGGIDTSGTPSTLEFTPRTQAALPQPGPTSVTVPTQFQQVLQSGRTGAIRPNRNVISGAERRMGEGQGEGSPPFNFRNRRVQNVTDYEGSGTRTPPEEPALGESQMTQPGTMTIDTPQQARQMLQRLQGVNQKTMSPSQRQSFWNFQNQLRQLASHQTLPVAAPPPRARFLPGRPGSTSRRVARKYPSRTLAGSAARTLPKVGEGEDER